MADHNDALRRVVAFIAQLAVYKVEAKRRQAQDAYNASIRPQSTAAGDAGGSSGVNEAYGQDCSFEGPTGDMDMDGSSHGVGETSSRVGTDAGVLRASEQIANRKTAQHEAHAQHALRADATRPSITDADADEGDSDASATTEADELHGITSSSSLTTAATPARSNSSCISSVNIDQLKGVSQPIEAILPLVASESDVEVVNTCLAPNREVTVIHPERCLDCMETMPGQNVTLEFLQSLSDAGKKEALQSAMAWCPTKELRSFCGGMGVRVRSKKYAAYHTKAGYTELLTQLLRAKSASKGLAVGPAPPPIVVTSVERTRKTKNCNLRLLNVLFSEFMAPCLNAMNSEPTQAELDSGAVGGNNPFWTRLRAEFISSKAEYSRLAFQGACLTGFDLSTPMLHSSRKLSEMWSELWGAYNSAVIRFAHSTDPNLEFVDCCPSRSDVFYMSCWLNVKPDLLSDICAKLPANVAMDSIALGSSVTANEGVVGVGDAGIERVESATPTRKRPRTVMNRLTRVDSVATSDAPNRDAERAALMQSIRHGVDILTMARGLDLGSEIEETVRCELQQYTKRLKKIQQVKETEETEEEKEGHYM